MDDLRRLDVVASAFFAAKSIKQKEREEVMSSKTAYEQKLKAQLDEWSAETYRMKAKADKADADAQLRFHN